MNILKSDSLPATSAFADISNVFNAKNILAYQYKIDNGKVVKKGIALPTIVPSLGISVQL